MKANVAAAPRARAPVWDVSGCVAEAATGAVFGVALWLAMQVLGVWAVLGWNGVVVLLVTAGVASVVWRWPAGRVAVSVMLGAAVLVAAIVMATSVTRPLVTSLIRRDLLPEEPADAVVVLSASVSDDGMLNPAAVDRLLTGLRLVREGRARALILSRPRHALRRGQRPDADWRRLFALLPAVPPVAVVDSPATTHDEALGAARIARERGWRSIVVVTSPTHTRRACATFERVGLRAVCVPSESREVALGALVMASDRLNAFAEWLYEAVGWWVYRSRGWV